MAEILRIYPGYSRQLSLFVWCTHLLALGLVPLLPISPWLRAAMLVLVVLSLLHNRNTHVLRSNVSAIASVEWDGEDEWLLFSAKGTKRRARLRGSSYVQPWLMVLNFMVVGKGPKYASLILAPDALDAAIQRRLRVRLRLQ
ncbi:protein YgfX [Pseudomonadota bacterium]